MIPVRSKIILDRTILLPMNNQKYYRAFMLKLIPVVSEKTVHWRVVLENPYTGERNGFKDLNNMVQFLHELLHEGGKSQGEQEKIGEVKQKS